MTLTEFLKLYPAKNSGTFGDFVTHKRAENGLSVRKLAAYLGISSMYLSQIERNERPASLNLLEEFKEFLEIKRDEEEMFNDIVYLSRETLSPEIIRYLIANPNARKAIRIVAKQKISSKNFLKIMENKPAKQENSL